MVVFICVVWMCVCIYVRTSRYILVDICAPTVVSQSFCGKNVGRLVMKAMNAARKAVHRGRLVMKAMKAARKAVQARKTRKGLGKAANFSN